MLQDIGETTTVDVYLDSRDCTSIGSSMSSGSTSTKIDSFHHGRDACVPNRRISNKTCEPCGIYGEERSASSWNLDVMRDTDHK